MINIEEYIKLDKDIRQKHLDLSEGCILRGTNSTQCRGLLAYCLDTTVPRGCKIDCCHACHNPDCSNPKHLYWGTRKENVFDMITAGTFIAKGAKGESNGNYGCKPWRSINAKIKPWSMAGVIYDEYVKTGWDFSLFGQGPSYLRNKYSFTQGASKNMIKMFKEGWNPYEDKDWVDFFKEYK